MALVPATIIDDVITAWEANDPEGFGAASATIKNNLRDGLVTSLVETLVTHLTTNASVTFSAGTITGNDSGGDTHAGLSGSGGTIS